MRKIKITKKNAGECHVTVGHVYKLDDGTDIGSTLRFLDDYGNPNLIQLDEVSEYFNYEMIYCEEPKLMASDMTLRDYFAAKYMAGCGAAPQSDAYFITADLAYRMADAMLKARE